MKIKIISVEKINNANVNITFDILKDDGTLLLHVDRRGFTSIAKTVDEATAELIKSSKNIRDTYLAEINSNLFYVSNTYVGKEIDIG
jgi:hypothetical protein